MKHRWKKPATPACALVLLLALLAGCSGGAPGSSAATGAGANSGTTLSAANYENVKDEDVDTSWSEESSTLVTFEGDSISVKGGGATADGSTLTITAAGTYVLSGSLSNGPMVVQAPDTTLVRIVMNGMEIPNEPRAASD